MSKLLLLFAAGLFVLAGCTAAQKPNTVLNDNKTVVFKDGINPREALVVAQMELAKNAKADLYDSAAPKIAIDVTLPNYKQHRFVYFPEKSASSTGYVFMVVIEKATGKIKFAQEYTKDNRPLLEAALTTI